MNDWLEYKGSGSVRSNNTMEHAYRSSNAPTSSGAYDSINKELDAFNTLVNELNQNSKTTRR